MSISRRSGLIYVVAAVIPIVVLATLGAASSVHAVTVIAAGYRAYEGGGGAVQAQWTTGNLGNTWSEGEWIPYKVAYFQLDPGLSGLDSIVISYEFVDDLIVDQFRWVDLVRGIQVGTTDLGDTKGWPGPDGNALPVTSRDEIEAAQNHVPENAWSGFTLLNLPDGRVNRTLSGAEDEPPGEERHMFKIYKSDLLAAGIGMDDTTLVIYFQFHEARTFVWDNQLQEGYAASPAAGWGGYLYGLGDWPDADPCYGSGYLAGASGYLKVETVPGGNQIPIPIPETAPGVITGSKWKDDDADGNWDVLEQNLPGWQIHISGELEGLNFVASDLTGNVSGYRFEDLPVGMSWLVKEDTDRYDPPQTGYGQTYPDVGTVEGIATGVAVTPPPSGIEPVGWEVELTATAYSENNLDFGNAPQAGIGASPGETSLQLAGRNPAAGDAVIAYTVGSSSRISLAIWSVEGELVRTVLETDATPGTYRFAWDGLTDRGQRAEPGIYFCRLKTEDGARSIKIVRSR
jgi:hypothetical protein